jgi:hypothetical protein
MKTEIEKLNSRLEKDVMYYQRLTIICTIVGIILGSFCTWAICYTYFNGGLK